MGVSMSRSLVGSALVVAALLLTSPHTVVCRSRSVWNRLSKRIWAVISRPTPRPMNARTRMTRSMRARESLIPPGTSFR